MKILLVNMPIASASFPNLGIERLAEILRKRGDEVDVLYGSLLFYPPLPSWWAQEGMAPLVFAPAYYEEDDEYWAMQIEAVIPPPVLVGMRATGDDFIRTAVQSAHRCIERCVSTVDVMGLDAIGFSIGFDSQRLPSAALAKKFKTMNPSLRITAGGTACDGPMGPALLKVFPCFDAVLSGEADEVIGGFFEGAKVPHASFRLSDRQTPRQMTEPIATPSLHGLPAPNYNSYITQLRASPHYRGLIPVLLYEASRGCWYGKKNHCAFCGIRNVTEVYRTADAESVIRDIWQLAHEYDPVLIYLTDAIISRQLFKEVFPVVAHWCRNKKFRPKLFIETKSNLTAAEVGLLSRANVQVIQPGIESFITGTLTKMNKGASGIQQIELLKWCAAFKVQVVYSLILGTPGETAEDLWDMANLCGLLHHLPAPVQAGNLLLHRFSPHFKDAERYDIQNVRPFHFQELMYRAPRDTLMELCYNLNFDLPTSSLAEIDHAKRAVGAAAATWRGRRTEKLRLAHSSQGDMGLIIRGDRHGVEFERFVGAAAFVLDNSHHATSCEALTAASQSRFGNGLQRAIEELEDRGLILCMDNRVLNLATPIHPHEVAQRLQRRHIPLVPT